MDLVDAIGDGIDRDVRREMERGVGWNRKLRPRWIYRVRDEPECDGSKGKDDRRHNLLPK